MEAIEDSTPRQVGSYRRFNMVCWRARFYGVPFGTPIDWASADVDNSPDVVTGETEAELRSRIDAQIVRIEQQAFDTPMQLESWAGFNIVRFQGEYFGVPHGQAGILWDSGIKQMAGVLCAPTPERIRELIAAAKEGGQHAFFFDAHDPA